MVNDVKTRIKRKAPRQPGFIIRQDERGKVIYATRRPIRGSMLVTDMHDKRWYLVSEDSP